MNELSKYLCFLLRHQPEKAKLDMDKHGWVSVEQLISNVNRFSKYHLDIYLLEKIVAEDDKGRYLFDESYERIKCCQGHSIPWVEPEIDYRSPPKYLYHGTTLQALEAIISNGAIKKMQRHAVHLHSKLEKAWESAERWGKTPVVLKIAAHAMDYDDFCFGVTEGNRTWGTPRRITGSVCVNGDDLWQNGIWLTEEVPVKYICDPVYEKLNGKVNEIYIDRNRKDILHISDVIYGDPFLCIVNDLRDYNRACFEGDELSDYNYCSDSKLLALDDYDIHGIINIEALVRIAQLDSSRLTEEQLRAAENKLKDKVIIDSSDVNFILDIIKSSKITACIPSKDSFYWNKDYSIDDIVAALHDLTEADYVANPDDITPKYIGDIVLTFKPKRQLNICNITKISNPTIQIKVDTDRRYYDTLVLMTIKDSDNQVIV